MPDRFNAFSFVDRITELVPGTRARGRYRVPAHLDGFPASLMAESVGQLAAWAAMDCLDYRLRPVAGIAVEAKFMDDVSPGQTLELGVELETCTDDDVVYSGWARADEKQVVQLTHCLGPMLPMTDFDDPVAVRERFRLLRGDGAGVDRFLGISEPRIATTEHVPGRSLKAVLTVPEKAPFFGDHFPRRPVYPATLLLDALIGVAYRLVGETGDAVSTTPIKLQRVINMKMRSFIAPGQVLELQVDLAQPRSGLAPAKLVARLDGRSVATARAEFGQQRAH